MKRFLSDFKKNKVILFFLLGLNMLVLSACTKETSDNEKLVYTEINEISIDNAGTISVYNEDRWIEEFVRYYNKCEATGNESTQDIPVNEENFTKIILKGNEERILYMYENQDTWYLEEPYNYILKTSPGFVEFISE